MRGTGTLALALIALRTFIAAPSEAVQVSVDFSITFAPPVGTTFAGGELTGAFQLYLGTMDAAGALVLSPLGNAIFPPDPIAPGGTFHPPDPIFPPEPVAPGQVLLFTFAGQIVYPPDPIHPPDPAFAFPPDPVAPDGPPSTPPFITLGSFTADITSLDASGPLFAFASPGTQVGTYDVTAQVVAVSMPATLALLAGAVVGLGAVRASRRRWRFR